jgi:hypothetical protein
MPVSPYFNNYDARYNEQLLVENLITESIQIAGFSGYYLPNDNDIARDLLYGEDPVKKFQTAFPFEMYLSSAQEYGGEKEFFSNFGLEIRNKVTVIISRRAFSERVPQNTFTRPREGDLIFVPFLNGYGELYEITFADQDKDFHTLGRRNPYYYELHLEKFKYSQEVIATGIDQIDEAVTESAYTLHLTTSTGTGNFQIGETVFQSDNTIQNATAQATVQSWIPTEHILSVTNIKGEFIDGHTIIGQTSNAHYLLSTFDPMESPAIYEPYDNKVIETSASTIIDNSETNPIGGL